MAGAAKRTVVFVTGNPNKLTEVLKILGQSFPFKLVNHALDIEEIQGTASEVAKAKCKAAADLIGGPVIIEDTALEFRAFGGLPGPYVRWFLEEIGPEGLHRMLTGWEDKGAHAVCTMAYSDGPGSEVKLFEGRTEGTIVEPRGGHGFGWDVCFKPTGHDVTYAEMEPSQKNQISHRSKAVHALKDFLFAHSN